MIDLPMMMYGKLFYDDQPDDEKIKTCYINSTTEKACHESPKYENCHVKAVQACCN